MPHERFEDVCSALESAGAHVERDVGRWQLGHSTYFEATLEELRVDVFFPDWALYDWTYERRRQIELDEPPSTITVLSVEDTLLFTLLFFRGKDKVDIENLMQVQLQALDLSYIRRALSEPFRDEEMSRWFEDLVGEVLGSSTPSIRGS